MPSDEIVHDSARPGITFDPPISISTRRSAICSLTSKLVFESVSAELSASGLASEHTDNVSACAPPAAKANAAPAAIQSFHMAHPDEMLFEIVRAARARLQIATCNGRPCYSNAPSCPSPLWLSDSHIAGVQPLARAWAG